MKTLIAVLALVLAAPAAFAQEAPRQLGVGVVLGTPFGVTAKYNVNELVSADLALGAQGSNFDTNFDALLNLRNFQYQPPKGRVTPYLGVGMKIEDQDETLWGIRFVAGASYKLPSAPLELFAEVAPVLRAEPSVGGNFDGGVGARWYFDLTPAR
ncbi:MAG: hypothetical protein KGL53_01650 [Elusimicrobia bacterium]|nr:hypothetical protein [Elusimicrobiota bacterium]